MIAKKWLKSAPKVQSLDHVVYERPLRPKYATTDCILEGFFRHESGTRVAVTGNNCPFGPESEVQVSFVSPRSPHMSLFDLNFGITNVHISKITHDITDEVMRPPKNGLKYRNPANISVPSNGFNLDVIVFYDTNFYNYFQDESVAK